jgi:hypothetical protein
LLKAIKNKMSNILRNFFVGLLSVCLIVKIYLVLLGKYQLDINGLFFLILLIVSIIIKTKTTWIIAIGLAFYGIYYFLFRMQFESWPRAAEFTSSLKFLLWGNVGPFNRLHFFMRFFPFVFYCVFLIILFIPKVRKAYCN